MISAWFLIAAFVAGFALCAMLTLGKGTADEVTITAAQLKQLLALLN